MTTSPPDVQNVLDLCVWCHRMRIPYLRVGPDQAPICIDCHVAEMQKWFREKDEHMGASRMRP